MATTYLNPFNGASLKGSLVKIKTDAGNGCFVYLPSCYQKKHSPEEQKKKYPILYHLHGAGSVDFMTKKDIGWTAEQNEIYNQSSDNEKKTPMIIVAPCDPTLFSMWADGKKSDMASRVLNDVMPYVESKYAVDTGKRYIQGFSMGGFGAATFAFKYPDKFKRLIIWDGALHDFDTLSNNRAFIAENQFGNNKNLFDLWSPWEATKKASENGSIQQTPLLIFTGSMNETRSYGKKFSTQLKELGANYKYTETEFPHCSKPFLEKYGQAAFAFLTEQS